LITPKINIKKRIKTCPIEKIIETIEKKTEAKIKDRKNTIVPSISILRNAKKIDRDLGHARGQNIKRIGQIRRNLAKEKAHLGVKIKKKLKNLRKSKRSQLYHQTLSRRARAAPWEINLKKCNLLI